MDICFGLIIISILITTFHFFYEIKSFLKILILLIGLTIFFKKKNLVNYKSLIKKKNFFYLVIIGLLIPMFVSQKYHEDFGYYHLPYAIGFIEEKIIFGFSNINAAYVYNSLWLNIYSIFFLQDKNFDLLTLPSFILYISFLFFSFNKITSTKNFNPSDYYLVVTIFYFLLKFTRISEFGVDLPAIIFSILAIRDQVVPPTINLNNPAVETPIDLVPKVSKKRDVCLVMSNSFGFGGTNASLVFRKVAA